MTAEEIEQIRTEIIECIKNYTGQAYPIREIDAILGREFTRREQYASTKADEVAIEFYFEATGLNEHPNSSKNGDAKIKEQLRKEFNEWYTQYKLSQI